ncbi:hypothetical protein G9A89_008399 [Geosiphon pyriformis]|nr:hypothetical protein G9A89_008399 [Geosiphon pyriformis]
MKKTLKNSGSDTGFKFVKSKKKRRNGVLEDGTSNRKISAEKLGSHLWSFEIGNTTESDSVDMKEECLVEETSFDYGKNSVLAKKNLD